MHILSRACFIVSFICIVWCGNGQGLPLPFRSLSVEDGLPQNSITALIQDDQGFLWIGTQDGLARYDGYDFKVFRHDSENPNSLSHNFIWNITKDNDGLLWITTLGNGLTRLDPQTMEFKQFLYNKEEGIGLSHWNTFSTLRRGDKLYVGTNNSLDCIDLNTNTTTTFYPGLEFGKDSLTSLIRAMVPVDDGDQIWMSTSLGLTLFDSANGSFTYFPNSPFGEHINLRDIYTIEHDRDELLITTSTHVVSLNFTEETETVLWSADELKLDKSTSFHGYLKGSEYDYVFSNNGLFMKHRDSGQFFHAHYDPANRESLEHDYVIAMMESNDGALWVGTRNGLSTVRFADSGFMRFGKSSNEAYSLLGKSAKAFVELTDSILLVGTSEGVEVLNTRSGFCRHIDEFTKRAMNPDSKYILSMIQDREGVIWAGARGGGLSRIEFSNSRRASYQHFALDGASIQFIHDADSVLWLGSSGAGLLKFSKEKGLLQSYPNSGDAFGPSHSYVYSILIDSEENFWLGTPTGGVNLFHQESERFLHLNEEHSSNLSGNTILCIFQDSRGRLWIGSSTGLSELLNPLSPELFERIENKGTKLEFRHYGRDAGFPNEVIYGILEDKAGLFWIGTNDGLVKFDPQKGSVEQVYKREHGCQSDEYNQNAYLSLSDGHFVYGGVNGLHIFHPDSLMPLQREPTVVITDVEVNKWPFSQNTAPTELAYDQNDISFRFAALSFINTTDNRFKYRLRGFDDTWYDRSTDRLVTYTNLDPGNYEFQVMAANCDGIGFKTPATFSFSIGAPPWLAWYAYLLYAAVIGGLVYLVLKWRTAQVRNEERRKLELEAARVEERELFRKRSARDFHDEAGNKITRINLLVELAKSNVKEDSDLAEYLSKIAQNTTDLSRGMRDFNWALDHEKDSLFDLLERVRTYAESMYIGRDAQFEMRGLDEALYTHKLGMELRRDLLLILKEAIHNAVKHSGSSKGVLTIQQYGQGVEVTFCDFGRGLLDQGKGTGYGLKNMKSRAHKHGIHLEINSEKERGVCVKLNLTQMGDRVTKPFT